MFPFPPFPGSFNPFFYINLSSSPFSSIPNLEKNPSCRGRFLVTATSPPFSPNSMASSAGKRPASDRYSSDSGHDHQHAPTDQKRPRLTARFASVVRKAWELNQLEKLCSALTPILRKVVSEEVERGLAVMASCHLRRSPSLRVRAPEPLPIHLAFPKTLKLPIFTMNRIVSDDGSPVQVLLTDPRVNPISIPFPIRLEIVVLDGDFPHHHRDGDGAWTEEEFRDSILRPREGKRPLLAGDKIATLRQGGGGGPAVVSFGDFQLTDNSSWVRGRKFRLGVRVIPGSCGAAVRIREAVSGAFVVRDHRGESYQKHYPPRLEDEVWRLEKIKPRGHHCKNLASAGIKTVQDFLKMHTVDPRRLQSILGSRKSKSWEASVKHAKTCEVGSKRYVFRDVGFYLVLDPICRVESASIGGRMYTMAELTGLGYKDYIDQLVKVAHSSWDRLEEIETNDTILGS